MKGGEHIILTKPIGTGLITTAAKAGKATAESLAAACSSMGVLNRKACEILRGYSVSACTDVTGFGLLGHACEMASESPCSIAISSEAVPLLPSARDYALLETIPGGTKRNRSFRQKFVVGPRSADEVMLNILFDPRAPGGLLAAVKASESDSALAAFSMPAFRPPLSVRRSPARARSFSAEWLQSRSGSMHANQVSFPSHAERRLEGRTPHGMGLVGDRMDECRFATGIHVADLHATRHVETLADLAAQTPVEGRNDGCVSHAHDELARGDEVPDAFHMSHSAVQGRAQDTVGCTASDLAGDSRILHRAPRADDPTPAHDHGPFRSPHRRRLPR